ncbi:RhoGEF domain-containing protein [Colletotrichum nymphaeae SA-01]|uniref:RhoGEF domain-containing protein n=1 Tax=Colletotrichum nymphaeae SA-01 TaxID=1460502 RepID=A0A135TBQ8_9PEZI|nr:RhoGEF domain-containing protein [Colletotrichum nymphaeae SA-01]
MLNQSLHRASAVTPNRRQLHLPAERVLRWHPIRVQDARSTDLDPTTMHTRDAFSGPAGRLHVAAAFLPTGSLVDSPGATVHRSSVPRRDFSRELSYRMQSLIVVGIAVPAPPLLLPRALLVIRLERAFRPRNPPSLLRSSDPRWLSSRAWTKKFHAVHWTSSSSASTLSSFPQLAVPANLHHSSLGVDTIHHVLNPLGTAIASFFGVLEPSLTSSFLDVAMAWPPPPPPPPPDSASLGSCSRPSSVRITRKTDGATSYPPSPGSQQDSIKSDEVFENVDLSSSLDGLHINGVEAWNTLSSMAVLGLEPNNGDSHDDLIPFPRVSVDSSNDDDHEHSDSDTSSRRGPFHKWMRTLHRRAKQRAQPMNGDGALPWKLLDSADRSALSRRARHRRSSSGSSFGFVAAVKSASVSLASGSAITRPRGNSRRSLAYSKTERSSRGSFTATRFSEDSCNAEWPAQVDPLATERALQRRRILEELISTEEGYIADVRFLMNVYITILASLPTLPPGLRSSINRNLTDIVELHEELLGELHRAVPDSEYTQMEIPSLPRKPPSRGHQRMRSLDSVPEDDDRAISWLQEVPGMISEAQIAGDVAKVFSRKMNRFFIYEEYGAKYEMMIKDVASAHRTMPQWDTYQRGIETLASSLGSANSHADQAKKSLTIGDLLVKPIQRICKYPLLFAELLKHTPVADCPNSHMEVESALLRLREATAEINRATNDRRMKSTLERTWVLQDRLVFPEQVTSASKVDQIYTIQACINLASIKIEETDNGRGLQCHTAPFSWKLVFECDSQLYEILMTACSPREQEEWRNRLSVARTGEQEQIDPNLYSSMSLNMKSLGTVFRKPGTVARRISIHRATTVGPKSPLCQVILKNTSVMRDNSDAASTTSINRSQSLLTTNPRIPILAPPRGERARLEALMSDIWSRDILPFPGMTGRSRSEHLVRSSASTMMRKLSVASIASSFAKRSNSVASMGKLVPDENAGEKQENAHHGHASKLCEEESPNVEHGLDDEAGETTKTRLPKIDDDVEVISTVSAPATPMLNPAKILVHADPVEQLRLEHIYSGDAYTSRPSILRTASGNNLPRVRRDQISDRKSPCPSEKGIYREHLNRAPKGPKLSHKASMRWGKVGTLNRDDLVQGIRSFFR